MGVGGDGVRLWEGWEGCGGCDAMVAATVGDCWRVLGDLACASSV